MTGNRPLRCLTIGSSDSSGGAGIQGDIKAFASLGCYAMTVVVGVTAQSTRGIVATADVAADCVAKQLDAVIEDIGVDAVKIGTTWSVEILEISADRLAALDAPLVLDPVMVTAAGSALGAADVLETLVHRLFPLAAVVTPNLREARLLAGIGPSTDRQRLAEAIVQQGARAVVITGGDGPDAGDWFFDGVSHQLVGGDRYDTGAVHGSGCAHSALVAGLLAHGLSLPCAVEKAHARAAAAVRRGLVGYGAGPYPVDTLGLRAWASQ